MTIEALRNLQLVGGTSLALQIGHRESIDIDLFGHIDFDKQVGKLNIPGEIQLLGKSKHVNTFSVDDVKVDIIDYQYPWLKKPKIVMNIKLASLHDIGAMKLNAIAGRGSKKDFIDLFFLLRHFSLKALFELYLKKFDDGNLFLVKKSLTYFKDADIEQMPVMHENISWECIKNKIMQEVKNYKYSL
ncbi:MAG: nucleotidyl transferase AbiEii/AbiGii toxin family protein [Bacteroidota bacterium]|nr:nucleotidyl transferase AbiEii/AbiGii toxin family protein [Bacteroidota bacterium]